MCELMPNRDLRQCARQSIALRLQSPAQAWPRFGRDLTLVDEDGPDGSLLFACRTDPSMSNPLGIVHGGITAALLDTPNNNLGVEYIRALNALKSDIRPVAVLRAGAGHDGGAHPDYPSASYLRGKILAGEIPAENPAGLAYGERAVLARLRSMDEGEFAALPDCGEGLSHRLYRAVGGRWRRYIPWPKPSAMPTPASAGPFCGGRWGCGRPTGPPIRPISGCWGPAGRDGSCCGR